MHNQCNGYYWRTDGAYPRHTLMAVDAGTKLSRPATNTDAFADLLGHLAEASLAVDPDLNNGVAGQFSEVTHNSVVYDGTVTGIASGAVTRGDKVGVGATAGQLEVGGALQVGIAVNDAAAGEFFAYIPRRA